MSTPSSRDETQAPRPALSWWVLVLDHVKPLRIPLLILLLGGVLAVNVDQVVELFLMALWVDPAPRTYLWLLAASALCGLSVSFATRQAYRLSYPRWPALQDPRAALLREIAPRALGAMVPLLLIAGYFVARGAVPQEVCTTELDCTRRFWRVLGLILESAVLIAFFLIWRPMLTRWRNRRGHKPAPARRPRDEPRVARLRDLGLVPLRIFGAALVGNVLMLVWVAWRPEQLAGIGPLAILLVAASFMCVCGGLLCMAADRRGIPLITLLALLTVLWHSLHLNDNHRVRQVATMSTHQRPAPPPAETRPRFDDYARRWLTTRCAGRDPCPVLLTSAEGGGIRGAAWTAMVLAQLNAAVDKAAGGQPLFDRYFFAGSGVSGGSLGLATYTSLRHRGTPPEQQGALSQAFLVQDFLAPTLANLFFVDFTQRWLPGAWFDDRGRALTRAWESAAQAQGNAAFAQPFSDLYQRGDDALPALFLNSTSVRDGERFVQHPFQPIATPARQPWTAALDGSAWLDPRVPLSEVVLNSARFTYLSPAGTLQTAGTPRPVPNTLQLVDGGYFEDSGTATLGEVMQLLRNVATEQGRRLRFIVIHISNDTTLSDFVDQHDAARFMPLYSTACPGQPAGPGVSLSGEVSAPIKALLNTRSARGDYARVQLLRSLHTDAAAPDQGDMLWHFRLCPGQYPMPLGWSLSAPVFTEMRRQLRANYPVEPMAQALARQLAPPQAPSSVTARRPTIAPPSPPASP